MYIDYLDTPIGIVEIRASTEGITSIFFAESATNATNPSKLTHRCTQQLEEYFVGKRKKFDVPLDQQGTEFQKSIWACLVKIPYGEVASYRDIAYSIHKPKAVRAVGAANGRNPISIIVPCHRVIGTNGSLTGYAWGLERKAWLLEHEQGKSAQQASLAF